MRKDGKSQYTIKKEKLLKIKKIFIEELYIGKILESSLDYLGNLEHVLNKIWEIVKDEK